MSYLLALALEVVATLGQTVVTADLDTLQLLFVGLQGRQLSEALFEVVHPIPHSLPFLNFRVMISHEVFDGRSQLSSILLSDL